MKLGVTMGIELISGRLSWLAITVVFSSAMLVFLVLAMKRIYDPKIRRHPGIDAIDEAIGRAVEMGQPVCYSPGIAGIYSTKYAADTSAALTILDYVAKKAVEKGAPIIVGVAPPTVLPLAEDIVKTAYITMGRPEEYKSGETVRFLSPHQWGFTSGYIGILHREKPAVNLLLGCHAAEAMIIAETGASVGAVQISGTTNVYQMPFFIAACDYTFLAEDEYAAAAYLSPDPTQRGVIFGQDIAKIICSILVLLGAISATFGIEVFKEILSL